MLGLSVGPKLGFFMCMWFFLFCFVFWWTDLLSGLMGIIKKGGDPNCLSWCSHDTNLGTSVISLMGTALTTL